MFDEESQANLRLLMDFTGKHARFSEITHFSIAITGRIEAEQNGELLTLKVVIDPPRDVKIELLEETASGARPSSATSIIPAGLVPHVPRSVLWQGIRYGFVKLLGAVFTHEALFHFGDVVSATLFEHDPTLGSKRQIIDDHIERTTERLKRIFQITTKGKPSGWTALELTRAITGIGRTMPNSQRTYNAIAKRMRIIYGEKAPASGEALRKLAERLGLDWKTLKSGQ
jgi:hypothetical protein